MNTIYLADKVAQLLPAPITLTDCFEQDGYGTEKITKYWFNYQDDQMYPFEFAVKIDRNWLDQNDETPIVHIKFSDMLAKKGHILCYENDILKNDTRKKELQDFYFRFEALVLAELKKTGNYGHKREAYCALFKDYRWLSNNKALTSSGRKERLPNLTFTKSKLWKDEEAYVQDTFLAEKEQAKRYIRYYLTEKYCEPFVRSFLDYVLQADKPIRIVKERSFWNYGFVVREDMLYADAVTLSKLGHSITYNQQIEEEITEAMKLAFDLFSEHSVVNLTLGGVSAKRLDVEAEFNEDNLMAMKEHITALIETVKEKDVQYETYEAKRLQFLDGLLDLHLKYENLYQHSGEPRYQRRAEKAKQLWLCYTK